MMISNEKLSAFLDGELPDHEMTLLRERIATDEELAERLEVLARVDKQVQNVIKHIDERPLPAAIQELAAKLDQRAEILPLPLWKRAHQNIQHYAVAAVTVAAAIGFILGVGLRDKPTEAFANWPAIATILETRVGGEPGKINAHTTVTNNLTFFNQAGEYCRQFSVRSINTDSSQNIACRQQGSWKLKASIPVNTDIPQSDYQTASGPGPIDQVLDNMMSGEVLSSEDEQAALNAQWPNQSGR